MENIMGQYRKDFIYAINSTKKLNLPIDDILIERHTNYLDQNSKYNINQLIEWNYKDVSDRNQLAICTRVCIYMLPLIRKFVCEEAFITIGDVICCGKPQYNVTIQELENSIRFPQYKEKLKLHTWITLSSMEIIDLTFMRALFAGTTKFEDYESMFVFREDAEAMSMRYIPMIIGDSYFYESGSVFNFLNPFPEPIKYPEFKFR